MSLMTTLEAIKAALTTALPGVTVLAPGPDQVPFQGPFPACIVTPLRRYNDQVLAGARGNPLDGSCPNLYSLVYLQRLVKVQAGETILDSASKVAAAVESIEAFFDVKANLILPDIQGTGQVLEIGAQVEFEFDRQGLLVEYLTQPYVGFYATFTVAESLRIQTLS